jgi:hypothetical protein
MSCWDLYKLKIGVIGKKGKVKRGMKARKGFMDVITSGRCVEGVERVGVLR